MLRFEVRLGACCSDFLDGVEADRVALLLLPCPLPALDWPVPFFPGCFLVADDIRARNALGFPAPNPPPLPFFMIPAKLLIAEGSLPLMSSGSLAITDSPPLLVVEVLAPCALTVAIRGGGLDGEMALACCAETRTVPPALPGATAAALVAGTRTDRVGLATRALVRAVREPRWDAGTVVTGVAAGGTSEGGCCAGILSFFDSIRGFFGSAVLPPLSILVMVLFNWKSHTHTVYRGPPLPRPRPCPDLQMSYAYF